MHDELPRVTPSLLRDADRMCPRRLHLEHAHAPGGKPSPLGVRGFEVTNRLQADALKAHADPSIPIAAAFVDPVELDHEQRVLYAAAARGYVARFADVPARATDLGFETEVPEVGVRLVGAAGVAVCDARGDKELRVLRIRARRPLLDGVDVRFALLRAAAWAPERLRLVALDLIEGTCEEHDIDVGRERAGALDWLSERAARIRARADRTRPVVGTDCGSCAFVPGCEPLTGARA